MSNKEKLAIYNKVKRERISATLSIDTINWVKRQMRNRKSRSFSDCLEQIIIERREHLEN